MEEFTEHCNKFYEENPDKLRDGYAPFCKHLFIPNFTEAVSGFTALTEDNV